MIVYSSHVRNMKSKRHLTDVNCQTISCNPIWLARPVLFWVVFFSQQSEAFRIRGTYQNDHGAWRRLIGGRIFETKGAAQKLAEKSCSGSRIGGRGLAGWPKVGIHRTLLWFPIIAWLKYGVCQADFCPISRAWETCKSWIEEWRWI